MERYIDLVKQTQELVPDFDFADFLTTVKMSELITLQKDAREDGDLTTLNAVLTELGRRAKNREVDRC